MRRWRTVLVAFFAAMGTVAWAQSTEAAISARLLDKPLYLRGMWGEDRLKFQADGGPQVSYRQVSWTEAGFEADRVMVRGDRLRVEGIRIGTVFTRDGVMSREPILVGQKPGEKDGSPEKVTIEIDGVASHDFGPALDAIFADGAGAMAASLPAIWQTYSRNFLLPRASQAVPSPLAKEREAAGVVRGGKGVISPRVVHTADPEFSETARRMRHAGNVLVYVWVEADGSTSHILVSRPSGLGLDEKAVEAVSQYRFTPAMKDGQPVRCDLFIDVNFQIF